MSRWLWPRRHHWLDEVPRALNASVRPSGDTAPENSLRYRSSVTAIGVPPVARTRKISFMLAMSREVDEK
jgi:hypothetical protein